MTELNADNKIVHGLWIGNELSNLELLTIKSFINNGHCFCLWLYQPLKNKLPKELIIKDANTIIPENQIFRYKYKNQFGHGKGSLGGFSDLFRYKLLFEYGGWWTDMDVTCIKPLHFDQPYVFRTHQELKLVGNLLKCPKNSSLMKECYELAVTTINEKNTDWHKPIQILVDKVKQHDLEEYIVEFTNPDSWKLIRTFLLKNKSIPSKWYAIHWVNEEWRRNHIKKEVFRKNSTFGKLMLKHDLKSNTMNVFSSLQYWFNLNYIVSVWRQLPWIIKRII